MKKRNGAMFFVAAGTMAVLVAGCGGGSFGSTADETKPGIEASPRHQNRPLVKLDAPKAAVAPDTKPQVPDNAPPAPGAHPGPRSSRRAPVPEAPPVDPAPPAAPAPPVPPAPETPPAIEPPVVPYAPLTDARVESVARAYMENEVLEAPITGYAITSVATASSGQWGKAVVEFTDDAGNVLLSVTLLVGNRGDYAEVAEGDWDPGYVGCDLPISDADEAELHVNYKC